MPLRIRYKAIRRPPRSHAWGLVPSKVSVGGSNSITISAPLDYRTFQRNSSDQAAIFISGNYGGSPTQIEASFNGGSYLTIDPAPSAGSYGGFLNNQNGGQGTLAVRFKNDTATFATKSTIGIGDIFACLGQSNMMGFATNNQVYQDAIGLVATNFANDYVWKPLVDPYDSGTGQVDSVSFDGSAAGSVMVKLATLISAHTKRPVAFIPCAANGTFSTQWEPGANHLDRTTLYGSANYRITQVGAIKAALRWQGESDASSGSSQAAYYASLKAQTNALFTDQGIYTIVAKLQNSSGIADGLEALVNAAIVQAWNDGTSVKAGPDLSDIGSDDSFHLQTDAKVAVAALRWWMAIYEAVYDAASGGGTGGLLIHPGMSGRMVA